MEELEQRIELMCSLGRNQYPHVRIIVSLLPIQPFQHPKNDLWSLGYNLRSPWGYFWYEELLTQLPFRLPKRIQWGRPISRNQLHRRIIITMWIHTNESMLTCSIPLWANPFIKTISSQTQSIITSLKLAVPRIERIKFLDLWSRISANLKNFNESSNNYLIS